MTQEQVKAIVQMLGTLIVTLCGIFGYSMAEETAQQVALVVAALVVVAFSVWKNANFTKAAAEGQRVTDAIKNVTKDTGEFISAELALELTGGKDDAQQLD